MTEKQPDWIEELYLKVDSINYNYFRQIIESHLPQESTYESGYQKGRDDMKREMEDKHQYRRFGELARFLLTIPMGKIYGYASKDYILKIEKMPYMDAEKPTIGYVDDGFDERIDNKSSD